MAHHAATGMVRSNELSKAENCEQKLELHIKVEQLRNMDWIGQSDPFAVIYMNSVSSGITPRVPEQPTLQGLRGVYGRARSALGTSRLLPNGTRRHPPRTAPWERIGKTEIVRNSLSASFSKTIPLNYFFERSQMIAIDVYDADGPSTNLLHHDYLGSAEISVPKIVRADGMCYKEKLSIVGAPGASLGFVTVIAENKALRREMAKMDIGVNISARPTWMSRFTGPFLVISRQTPDRSWIPVYRSPSAGRHNAQRGRYAYDFDKINEPWDRLSLGRDDTKLRFEVVCSVRSRDRVVAAAALSFREWEDIGRRVPLVKNIPSNANTTGTDRFAFNAKSRGEMELRSFIVQDQPQFIDYVMGGCEMSLVIGVDFTASNGDSMQPSSLHFCDQYRPNEYELAIRAVGDILAKYDSDNRFPAYGFGARLPPDFDSAQHCFSLTGATDPTCYEIDGVLDAYRQSLYNVRLSGPTEFGLLIRTAAEHAQSEAGMYNQAYTILLIVTDGVINDFDETTRAIVEASVLPLSIVIIGVGDADFTAMDALDGDEVPLCRRYCRDIVQFVPFRKYQGKPDLLVSKVLEEIPNQLVEYMTSKNILPNPVRPTTQPPRATLEQQSNLQWQHLYGQSPHPPQSPHHQPPHHPMAANSALYSAEQGNMDDNVPMNGPGDQGPVPTSFPPYGSPHVPPHPGQVNGSPHVPLSPGQVNGAHHPSSGSTQQQVYVPNGQVGQEDGKFGSTVSSKSRDVSSRSQKRVPDGPMPGRSGPSHDARLHAAPVKSNWT